MIETRRQKQNDRQHHRAEHRLPLVRKPRRSVAAQYFEQEGAERRTENARLTAEEDDKDEIPGGRPIGELRINVTRRQTGQGTASTSEYAGDPVGNPDNPTHGESEVLDADLVVRNRSNEPAKPGPKKDVGGNAKSGPGPDAKYETGPLRIDATRPMAEIGHQPDVQAVAATEQTHLGGDAEHYHRHGQCQHREKDASIRCK